MRSARIFTQDLEAALRRCEDRSQGLVDSESTLVVESLDRVPGVFAAVDKTGAWAVAISTTKSSSPEPALDLAAISAEFGRSYILASIERDEEVRVSVVRCKSMNSETRHLFATFVATLISDFTDYPSDNELSFAIEKWIRLFWRIQSPPRGNVIGLIGEITMIDVAEDKSAWTRSWHLSKFDNIDFVFTSPIVEIEVKATTHRERVHELSYLQSSLNEDRTRLFASVQVELRDAGITIGEVARDISDQLFGEEVVRFWKCIVDTCGSSYQEFMSTKFDRAFSRGSVAFFRAEDVPRPAIDFPLPAGVSGIRFRSDFSHAIPIDLALVFDE